MGPTVGAPARVCRDRGHPWSARGSAGRLLPSPQWASDSIGPPSRRSWTSATPADLVPSSRRSARRRGERPSTGSTITRSDARSTASPTRGRARPSSAPRSDPRRRRCPRRPRPRCSPSSANASRPPPSTRSIPVRSATSRRRRSPCRSRGEVLSQWIHQGVDVWHAGPIGAFVEEEVTGWLRDLVGFDEDGWGVLTSGGVMANVMALALARDVWLAKLRGTGGPPRGRGPGGRARLRQRPDALLHRARRWTSSGSPKGRCA